MHSVVVVGVMAKEPMTTKQLFVDNGIRASFVGASVATWLVVEDSTFEELKEVLNHRELE